MFSPSILFVSTPKSRIAKGMLEFILTSLSTEQAQIEELTRLVQLVGLEEENLEILISLNAHCSMNNKDRVDENKLAKVCDRSEEMQKCCYLQM